MPFISYLDAPPRRIVSLVPSQTELLFHLGLENEIAGITKFCVHPAEKCQSKPKVGGTKGFRFEVIDQLQPDLILANKEENYRAGIEQLAAKYPVWMSDIVTLADARQMIKKVGELTGKSAQARQLSAQVGQAFDRLPPGKPLKVAYLIWRKPYMAAGSGTFIHEMLGRCGFVNVFAHLPRYPHITEAMLTAAQPDYLLLSSEPYPFTEKHVAEFESLCPAAHVILVDGELFSWYGSRLLYAVPYFEQLIREINDSSADRQ